MRLIDADELKKDLICFYPEGVPSGLDSETMFKQILHNIDNAPTVEDLISAKDFKKRINNMEYVYLQECAADVIDAIDCEVTYFKEKMNHGKK